MQDLNDLYYYVKVVDHGGFASASRILAIPKSKLSRRIALLEERLGVRLIQRSTRRFSVTEIGQTYYEHCNAMLVEAEAAQESIDVTRAKPCGTIRLTCPPALLHAHIGSMLADFMALNPLVAIHLEASNRRVDPIGEGIDLAIRVRQPPIENSDLVMRIFSDRRQCLVASPALIERYGLPSFPADLADRPSLSHGTPQNEHIWILLGPDNTQVSLRHAPKFISNDMIALRTAAVAGIGIAKLPAMFIRGELANGSLVKVLPEWTPNREIIHAVYPSRRGLLPSVRALIDFLSTRYGEMDEK
ncbi:LysR family transcriptional regulator [Methylomicrobium sp. Wu6]|uniref:LysR family transcriptional regulator n=1 Tax=Methylomicrobium sp. Wu6 TaxID=3107928 RepID=UPI002DD6628B|nr:LysR family transcriptional regulator [Methylomicrobium sp. Wu6]MEC4749433.1 LysR family transcriptional regulator [Methylomicrobium sp. Wu6]